VSFLLGIRQVEDLDDYSLMGSLFENLVISDILKKTSININSKNFGSGVIRPGTK